LRVFAGVLAFLRDFAVYFILGFWTVVRHPKIIKTWEKNRSLSEVADMSSDLMKEIVGLIGDFSAIIHYFSDFMVAILIYNLIFEGGTVGLVLIWLVIGLISAVIAELLKSKLPTPLRIILKRK
jgi:hypothetical protein